MHQTHLVKQLSANCTKIANSHIIQTLSQPFGGKIDSLEIISDRRQARSNGCVHVGIGYPDKATRAAGLQPPPRESRM
jgi:hypothetical protein